ncbi:MATE family efflux transporter [Jeongeupia naejangsanensis]|nr:MATE family efflux transporter [Jeongeupia naejangsanensis]
MLNHIDGDFFRKLFKLALPISMQTMLFSVLGLVDAAMVAHLGSVQIAAVGLASKIFLITFLLLSALSSIFSINGAQYFGAQDMDKFKRCLCQALICCSVMVLPIIIFCATSAEEIMGLASTDAQLIELSSAFLLVTCFSYFSTALVLPVEAALHSAGEAKWPTWIGLATVLSNIVLNFVFIYGFAGLPAMGVTGSALGTSCARVIQLALLLLVLFKKYPQLVPGRRHLAAAFEAASFGAFLKQGIPLAIHNGIWGAGFFVYQSIYGRMGTDVLSVINLLAPFDAMMMSAFVGLSTATSIMLGHELGANNLDRARGQSRAFLLLSPLVALLAALVTYAFSGQLVWLLNGMQQPLAAAQGVLTIMAFGLCLKVINFVGIIGILRSGGDIKYTMFIDQFGLWCVGIPVAWWAGIYMKLDVSFVIALVLLEELAKAFLTIQRVLRGVWVRNLAVQ